MAGSIILSLDFELGWGVIENGRWKEREANGVYRNLRAALEDLVCFLDERQLSLSWATVGAMVTERSSDSFSHLPDSVQKTISRFLRDAEGATYDGRDLFDKVLSARTRQQIGSHSYSHTRFNMANYEADARLEDTKLGVSALGKWGVKADSFVFPLNIDTDYAALAGAGIRVGRAPVSWVSEASNPLKQRIGRQINAPPPVLEWKEDDGVVRHSGSMFFNWHPPFASIRKHIVRRKSRLILKSAMDTGQTYHLWFHPFNLVETSGHLNALKAFLEECAKMRDSGLLTLKIM